MDGIGVGQRAGGGSLHKSAAVRLAAWIGLGVLATLGFIASLGRSYSVVEGLRGPQPPPEMSSLDVRSTRDLATLLGVQPGTPKFEHTMDTNRRFLAKFNRYPATTLLHVAPGALFMLMAPLQFSRRIRSRHLKLHRWSGRVIVAIGIPIGISGLFFGLFMPFAGLLEASAIALFGAIFLFAIVRAFVAIRRKQVDVHREWMIRMFALGMGVVTTRLVGVVALFTLREGAEVWFGHSVWLGFGLNLAAAEFWIAITRRRSEIGPVAIPAGVSLPTQPGRPHVGA